MYSYVCTLTYLMNGYVCMEQPCKLHEKIKTIIARRGRGEGGGCFCWQVRFTIDRNSADRWCISSYCPAVYVNTRSPICSQAAIHVKTAQALFAPWSKNKGWSEIFCRDFCEILYYNFKKKKIWLIFVQNNNHITNRNGENNYPTLFGWFSAKN